MKIYLAGPMRGLPDCNFPEFHKYAAVLRSQGHEVFSPAEVRIPQNNIRAIFALEMDWLCREAEAIALMPGWSESRGASAELALAKALDLKVMGVPGFHPTRPLGRPFLLEQLSLTTSPLRLPRSRKYPWPGKNSMELQGGIDPNLETNLTPSSAIISTVVLLTVMGCVILLNWLGGH